MKIKKLEDLGSQKSLQNDVAKTENFWRQLLHNLTAPPPLTVAQNSGSLENQNPSDFKEQTYRLSMETTLLLHSLSEQYKLNIYTFLQAAWSLMLHRYSGEEDIIFGINQQDNILPMRLQVIRSNSLLPWLQAIQQQSIAIAKYQHTPLSKIQEWSGLPAEMPLFESLLLWENCSSEIYSYPLILIANLESELSLKIKYHQQCFDDATIARMLGHFKTLIESIANLAWQSLLDLPMLTAEEKNQLLIDWNQTRVDYSLQLCLHQLIEKQVEQTPDAIAVVFEDKQLTYRELNAKANQLAGYLQSLGVKPETIVGVCLERSLEMPIALLGILKAGGAYVPLDPSYPQERLQFMLQDTQVSVLVTQQNLIKIIPEYQREIISLDTDWEKINLNSSENLTVSIIPENLAYTIYTSGSTGQPKGVLVEHKAICHQLLWRKDTFQLTSQDRILQTIPLAFDPSVWQIFGTLISGSTLIVAPPDAHKDSAAIVRLVAKYQVTILDFVPSMLKIFLEEPGLENCSSLRHVFCGGEALPATLVEQFKNRLSATISNQYGPTEACIDTTFWHSHSGVCNGQIVPIGRPITNKQVYILDSYLQPVPIGVPGELYVGGSLARGYLNRPELTADRFISLPNFPSPILYQTGDLVRYLSNGDIEYLGRIDNQVKIRGVRIEIGEIEAQINQISGVRESLVIARPDRQGRQCLVAYIIPEINSEILTATSLRQALSQRLPAYMIPSYFVMLAELPKLPNGKINRRELPAPEWFSPNSDRPFQVPRNSIEQAIADIFAQIIGLEKVSIEDNFFELGGHSLLATQIISRTSDTLGIELFVSDLFQNPSVAQMSAFIQQKSIKFQPKERIHRRQENDPIPLSFAQKRLWFLDRLKPGSPLYNTTSTLRLTGELNVVVLERSINEIIRRHEALRTTFASVDGQPIQVISFNLSISLPVENLQHFPETERELQAKEYATKEAQKPFNLSTGPLLRTTLLKLSDRQHWLLVTMHHIVCDGWSIGVFFEEMAALYKDFLAGKSASLAELPIQYADFALWQRQWLQGEVLASKLNYWKQQLSDNLPTLQLPTDRSRSAVQTYQGAIASFQLSHQLSEGLKGLRDRQGASLFMILLAAFKTLLYRYSGQEDILLGTAIANRNRLETEGLIGFFVNTLALRTDLSGNPNFIELLARVRQVALGAYANQDLPFEKLVTELHPQRNLSQNPLFQVMFVLQNELAPIEIPEQTVEYLERWDLGIAKFDLTLELKETANGIAGWFEYNTDLFDALTIARMSDRFSTLLESIIANPNQPISELSLLSQSEEKNLLEEWNNTASNYPQNAGIHDLFAAQVEKTPDAIAVIDRNQQLTYRELNAKANKLARRLQKLGVRSETFVGICVERSLTAIIGILAILKAGGVYVPLDPAYPQSRLAFMLEDTQIRILLTQQNLVGVLPSHQAEILYLDRDWEIMAAESPENITVETKPDNLAYIMYTSGSTGKPKGTCITHRGVVRLVKDTNYVNFSEEEVFLQLASICFDASTFEIWGSLLNGAKLVLIPTEKPSLEELGQAIRQYQVTTLWLTAGLFHLMVDERIEDLKPLRQLLAGGDVLSVPHVRKVWRELPECRLINGYGPTENTTFTCCYSIVDAQQIENSVPIGRPIANTQVYILDRNLKPVPIGVPGELYAGGAGLARGYLNRPDLDAEKFIPNPFLAKNSLIANSHQGKSSKLYKTGDLARYLPDGNIEFLGRIDNQVKIRGFRIELGEIEAVLSQYPAVQQTVVVAREDVPGNKYLAAYIVPEQDSGITVSKLLSWLEEKLPDYAIPSAIVLLDNLPLTDNGKVDRRALPVPEPARQVSAETMVAPRDEWEIKLANIWKQVLGIESIGIKDNFFDLGGHSLLALRLFAQIERNFGKNLPIASIFQSSTIEAQAKLLHPGEKAASWSCLVALQPQGTKPPFFWIPPGGCTALRYTDLARSMGSDRPCYSFQPDGIDGTQLPLERIEDIAIEYLKEVKTVQPQGPYFLGGQCAFGCLVAFEMAQQLKAQGQEVAKLVMLDPRHEIFLKNVRQQTNSGGGKKAENSLEFLNPKKSMGFYLRRFVYLWQNRKVIDRIRQKIQQIIADLFRSPESRRVEKVFRAHLKAVWYYQPKVYPGRIALFQSPHRSKMAEYQEWSWMASEGLDFYTTSSGHKNILAEPHVQNLANQLKELLGEDRS